MKNDTEGYNKDTELNLMDLLVYYMKKWKCLLVLVIVMALIGSGARLYIGTQNMPDTEEEIRNYSISSAIKSDMDTAYNYQKLYDTQSEYTNNSILMNLDYSRVYTGALRYVIYTSADVSTASIGGQIADVLNDAEVWQKLKNITGCSEDAYISEIAGTTLTYPSATAPDGTIVVSSDNLTVSFWLYAPDEEIGHAMVDAVKEKVDPLVETLLTSNEGYTIQKSEESVTPQINTTIRDQQAANADLLTNYSVSLNKYIEDFTEKQQAYYNVVYLNKEVSADHENGSVLKFVFEGIGLGGLLGILTWVCYGFLSYLKDKHVKYAGEMRHYYGVRLIGRYWPNELTSDKIEKWYEKIKSRKVGPCNDENYLASALQLYGKKICLVGSIDDSSVRKLGEILSRECESIICGDLMQKDSKTMEKAKNADGIVLLVHRGISTYQEIRRELEICSIQEIQVLGTIMVE